MKEKFYGNFQQNKVSSIIDQCAEEIFIKGFTIIPKLIPESDISKWRKEIDRIYSVQEKQFGRNELLEIQELDICRAPLLYNFEFISLASHPLVMEVVTTFLGNWFILNLQNAIISRPSQVHHQSSWHRDLPYQNYIISKPIAINALFAIDDFSKFTGGTEIVPFSHKTETLPSDEFINNNRINVNAPAGSVILFDSMLFHRAGFNRSKIIRRAVNHVYSTPILKQQYDFPRALENHKDLDPEKARLLGLTCQVPLDDRAWRENRAKKLKLKLRMDNGE